MKKFLLIVVAAMMAMSASAQKMVKKIQVYEGNTVVYQLNYSLTDSIVIREVPAETPLKGIFSVSATEQVQFSKGNFQYQPSTQTCRFAENQYDYICKYYKTESDALDAWYDLFNWGKGDTLTFHEFSTSNYTTFVDWGVNRISNGDREPDLWRTLSKAEWDYLLTGRTNAASLWGGASVNGTNGLILLPDSWSLPAGASFTAGIGYANNSYTTDQWAVMENAGAVFLPAAGLDYWFKIEGKGNAGYYWTSTKQGSNGCAYWLMFNSEKISTANDETITDGSGSFGVSVRLVIDY